MKVIKENCDPKDAQDKSLPYTAYLIEYKVDGKERYDISLASKCVDQVSKTKIKKKTKRIV